MGRLHRRNEPHVVESLASGNIAQVLRQARASLKDPSRPYTPAERRLRSTESLFGEGGFRPTIAHSGAPRGSTGNYHRRSGLSRKRSSPGQGQPKKHAAGSSRSDEAARPADIPRLPEKCCQRGSTTAVAALEVLNATAKTVRASSVIDDDGSPARSARQPSSRSPRTDEEGILYLDQGRPRGARSRSIVNQWDVTRIGRSTRDSRSSSSSGSSSLGESKTSAVVETTTKDSPLLPLNSESGEYEGLYGSDVDIDTTAWDLGSLCSGVSDNREEGEGEHDKDTPSTRLGIGRAESDEGSSEVDFVLDAIDNEVELGVNGLEVDNDEYDVLGSERAGPPLEQAAASSAYCPSGSRDASPDPGTLEEERERNTRLAGLLRMLRDTLHCATDEKPKGSRMDSVGEESWTSTMSPSSATRTLGVLVRVMNRPPGSEDASPSSIAELPALLAARLIVGLVLPPPLQVSPSKSGGSNSCRRASRASANGGREDDQSMREKLLLASCGHMFEVSKRPGADEAFVSSGTLEGLMAFVKLAASNFNSIYSARASLREDRGDTRKLGVEASRQRSGCDDGADSDNSDSQASCSRGRFDGVDDADTNRKHSEASGVDGLRGGTCGGLGSMCDSLTFALGCLKNISAGESVQDRLVRAGSVQTLCRLVRSTRDICRRCECLHKHTRGAQTSNRLLNADVEGKTTNLFGGSSTDARGEQLDFDTEGGYRQDTAFPLRKRVSLFLAQAISLLRDLAVGEKGTNESCNAAAGVVGTLCSILRPFRRYPDVVLNTARVLAKLSLQERTRAEINSDAGHMRDLLAALIEQGRRIEGDFSDLEETYRIPSCAAASLTVFPVEHRRVWETHEKRLAACVRIAFALGNLTSASDENRRLIGVRLGGAESLPALLLACSRAHLSAWECRCAVDGDHAATIVDDVVGGAKGSPFVGEGWARTTLRRACDGMEEMLVKTVRLLANISIHREVGQQVCRQPGLIVLEPLLDRCLELFGLSEDGSLPQQQSGTNRSQGSERHNKMVPGEELLLNVASLVTNLSFYGPVVNNLAPPPPGRASPVECTGMIRSPAGSDRDSPGKRRDTTGSPSSARAPHANVLFALASKARRGLDDQDLTLGTPPSIYSIGVAPARCDEGVREEVDNTLPAEVCPNTARATGKGYGAGRQRREVLCGHLVKVLLHPNVEAVAEAARAFGNFSRDPSCRRAIAERRGDEVLVALLGHPCREVVFAAAGAVVNLAGDRTCRARLCREEIGTGERLARLVRRAGLADPGMAELACQALHNLLMVEEPPLGRGGRGGVLRDILGGPEAYKKLWWTLKELTEACSSCEGRGVVGEHGGEPSDILGGFLAAAKAVWRAMEEGGNDRARNDSLYDEL